MNRIEEYIQYHVDSSVALDIDPQVEAIQYLCNRFELNVEQRYWLSFLYSELLNSLCGLPIGVKLDLREAESSSNGAAYALGLEDVAYTGRHGKKLPPEIMGHLNKGLHYIASRIADMPINPRHKTLWSIETTLCAYKKHKLNGKRWIGYYIERMGKEIQKMEAHTSKQAGGGVCWTPLWQFRAETYNHKYLREWQHQ